MPHYSVRSKSRLEQCHPDLQRVFNEVIRYFDCTITEGYRSKEDQNRYFDEGRTKVRFPGSKHNKTPALAVDATPYPVDYRDRERQTYFAGFVLGLAQGMGVELRWGGDWDQDTEVTDNVFDDFPHFELRGE